MAFGDVVGGRHVAVGHEHEQMRSMSPDALAQLFAVAPTRRGGHNAVEPSVEIGVILRQCGVEQARSPSSDGDRAQEQSLELGAEYCIAAIDRVLRIPQQMREAHLPLLGMTTLAAERIGHPNARPNPAEDLLWHDLATVCMAVTKQATGSSALC